MKLSTVEIFRYTLPFIKPLRMMGQVLTERNGLLIRFQDQKNHSGRGEIAPFPGLHRENLSTAEAQFLQLRKTLRGQILPPNLTELNGAFEEWLREYRLFPSVRYGIETAVLNLLANASGQPLCALLSPDYRRTVSINGLLSGSPEEIQTHLKFLIKEGYRAVKLKVGRQSLEQDIALVREVRNALPSGVSLRLDANRAWRLREAVDFARAIHDCRIEYIEEPLRDPSQLGQFHAETGLPLALDETLAEILPQDLRHLPGLAALVLKPSVLGGFEKTMLFARLAATHKLKAVISSAFSSGVGLAAEAALAACVNNEDVPAGLDTYKWVKEDVLVEKFPLQNGQIEVEEAFRKGQVIRMEGLERI